MNAVDKFAGWFNEEFPRVHPKAQLHLGYIYVMKAPDGLYKIGRTQNPQARVKELMSVSPVPLELYRLFYSVDYIFFEHVLHEMFEEKREHGEWFRLSQEDVYDLEAFGGTENWNLCPAFI